MRLLETKEQLTLNELLRIAYEYGNDGADMPADAETVNSEFSEWIETTTPLFKKLIIPLVSKQRELLIAFANKLLNILGEDCNGVEQIVDMHIKGNL